MPKSLAICIIMSVYSHYDIQSHVLRCVANFSRLTGLYIFFLCHGENERYKGPPHFTVYLRIVSILSCSAGVHSQIAADFFYGI